MLLNTLSAQEIIPLYKDVPNSKPSAGYQEKTTGSGEELRIEKVTNPTIQIFRPTTASANKSAVIICPGGGYQILAYNKEGVTIAQIMSSWGVTAVVLKYRLPSDEIMKDKSIGPLQDAEQAILYLRQNASQLGIDPHKIGIMGFSAGGHLASTLSTHYDESYISNPDRVSLRPDFTVLGYPVISLTDQLAHMGSRNNLIGKNPSPELIDKFSNELHVDAETPPAFIVLADDDKGVRPENSIRYYEALLKSGVSAEMHIYQHGGHGFGIHNGPTKDSWMNVLKAWMQRNDYL